MVLAILGICVVVGIVSAIFDFDGMCVLALVVGIVCIIAVVDLGVNVSMLSTVDARIDMYTEQNAKIEAQIADVVEQYMEYESGVFTEVASDSAITLVSLYPELKADTLVASQIDLYTANNQKITELREKQINGSVLRWWLYFGG